MAANTRVGEGSFAAEGTHQRGRRAQKGEKSGKNGRRATGRSKEEVARKEQKQVINPEKKKYDCYENLLNLELTAGGDCGSIQGVFVL